MDMATPKTPHERAQALYSSLGNTMQYLAERWDDEKGYEPISDYQAIIEPKILQAGGTIDRMTKTPFGVEFTIDSTRFFISVIFKGDEGHYEWGDFPIPQREQ